MAYLFVHFRETTTPDGEQVYFGVSRDGFHWEEVYGGKPVLWAYYGDMGVRDHTIVRCSELGKFYILATDLSLSYGMRGKYHHSWAEIGKNGSKDLALWESTDLLHWSEQRMIHLGDEDFGCLWAPDVIRDRESGEYIIHFSSSHKCNDYGEKGIYYVRTKDFEHFSKPEVLYRCPGSDVIDSAIYEEDGKYYMFIKSSNTPSRCRLLAADSVTGPYEFVKRFDERMLEIEEGMYEAPTAVKTEEGKWCLFLDYYGKPGAAQGYVPFLADTLASGDFVRSDAEFSFPYGFKHGTILKITDEEYTAIKEHDWVIPDGR